MPTLVELRDSPGLQSQALDLASLGNVLQAQGRCQQAAACYELALRIRPDWPEAHNNLGTALRALDRHEEAVQHYEAALRLQPAYPEALNNLGSVFYSLHRFEEAIGYYSAALAINPEHVTARNNLGSSLQELGRYDEALAEHQAALSLDPGNIRVHQALAILHLKRCELDEARVHGRAGFGSGVEHVPFRGSGQPVSALVLTSALGGGVRLDPWLHDQAFSRWNVTMEFWDEATELPGHDLVVNTVGEADRCGHALLAASRLVECTSAPVINPPKQVLATTRVENARRLAALPGVVAPKAEMFSRDVLASSVAPAVLAKAGLGWPLLLRAPGYHTGEHFEKIDRPDQLASAVDRMPGSELLAIEYLDTYDSDGSVRKYRALIVDGRLYPLHLAVARNWKVHFMTAGMAGYPEHRAEDERFLADMPGVLGPSVMAALARVREALGLDYGGIDFGIDAQGRLVVWEANATMVAPEPAPDPIWEYRRPVIQRAHAAVQAMLLGRATNSSQAVQEAS